MSGADYWQRVLHDTVQDYRALISEATDTIEKLTGRDYGALEHLTLYGSADAAWSSVWFKEITRWRFAGGPVPAAVLQTWKSGMKEQLAALLRGKIEEGIVAQLLHIPSPCKYCGVRSRNMPFGRCQTCGAPR